MIKEIPMLFSTHMVQAQVTDRKTLTCRVINPQPIDNTEVDGNFFDGKHRGYVKVDGHPNWRLHFAEQFCKYQVGDLLWVRETWQHTKDALNLSYDDENSGYIYKASDNGREFEKNDEHWKWKSTLHMPKDAARIWNEVTSKMLMRIADITEEQAQKEGFACVTKDSGRTYKYGIPDTDGLPGGTGWEWCDWTLTAKDAYRELWQSINGKPSPIQKKVGGKKQTVGYVVYPFDEEAASPYKGCTHYRGKPLTVIVNPWVFAVGFKVLSTTGKPA